MADQTFSFTTPSLTRQGGRTSTFTANYTGAYTNDTSKTPNWMTEQRNKRKKKYGKRGSKINFGNMETDDVIRGSNACEEFDFDDDINNNGSMKSKTINITQSSRDVATAESARYPRRNRSRSMRSNSPDLNSSMEQQEVKKAKKKRTDMSRGRPPLPTRAATRSTSMTVSASTTSLDSTNMECNASAGGSKTDMCTNSDTKEQGIVANRTGAVTTPFFTEGSVASRTRSGTPSLVRSYSVSNVGGNTLDFNSAAQTPAANTRRQVLRRSQSVEVNSSVAAKAAETARMFEENVHPNDTETDSNLTANKRLSPLPGRRTRSTKKRTASITGMDVKASPPKLANRKTSANSFSSKSFSSSGSCLEESFSNLAKKDTPSWGHKRSFSQSYHKTPMNHARSSTFAGQDWNINEQVKFLSPSMEEEGRKTPMIGTDGFALLAEGSPGEMSPPSASSLFASPDGSVSVMDTVRDVPDSDNESMASCDENSIHSSSSEENMEEEPVKLMTDAEIFDSKSSYEDFKFLLKTLMKWSKTTSKSKKIASMGLSNGCQIAVPPQWTHVRKSNFIRWASVSCGFRISNVGQGLSILRCVEAEGLEILAKLKRILEDHKAGRLGVVEEKIKPDENAKAKDPVIKLNAPSAFPFCEDNDDEDLAESFEKQVNIDKPKKNNSVSSLRRSISLQPLAARMRSPLPMLSRRLRLSTDSHDTQMTIDSNRKVARLPPPRLSTESAMSGTDFLSQLHGTGTFSPISDFLPKMRQRAGRMLKPKRPSLERPRLSFENSTRTGKPYESPHPYNTNFVAQNTPLPRADFGSDRPWETPMPKKVEHWGSQPIAGKDWGESDCCNSATLKSCKRVFAQAWFKSEFNNNESMRDTYKISFPDDERASLHKYYNSDSDIEEENYDDFDFSPGAPPTRKLKLKREDSVGGSQLALLQLNDVKELDSGHGQHRKTASRRSLKLRKYRRMSLCVTASDFMHPKRCLRHSNSPKKHIATVPDASLMNEVMNDGPIFSTILSFFDQTELLQTSSLVCTDWADAAAEALGNLMIASVGCDPSIMSIQSNDDTDEDLVTPRDDAESTDDEHDKNELKSTSIARSMERDWSYFTNYSTGKFLSQGAFKKVFKVWNKHLRCYEALSVMDVDTITETGNLHTVGAELAVSSLLSSMARRNIAPNFVITRGIFTCQYDLPSNDWDNTCDGGEMLDSANALEQGECGNFQYIRMELCKHADTEEYIRSLPNKMLAPHDCRNLLFQMAFSLHVAGDKLGMKHYDVKLLNFFVQSALDESVPEYLHPPVVLRYGVGSSVFRLSMHPSTALIIKLADYGTSVLRSDSDGQPISIGQFTTFENTPPDYLILGNDAKQGYGHDCFGLGLSMLHLFTGHCPYEEILKDVVCPNGLKTKLRKIWNSPTHDIISSAMMYEDSDEREVEDETFYDTLYRFIVLFGMPKHKIKYEGKGKVRRAVNSTLFKDTSPDSTIYESDRRTYSLAYGNNEIISNARSRLEEMDGAMELLLSLVCFDPSNRATPLDVINSKFMAGLVEANDSIYDDDDTIVRSYMSYHSTK